MHFEIPALFRDFGIPGEITFQNIRQKIFLNFKNPLNQLLFIGNYFFNDREKIVDDRELFLPMKTATL